MGCPRPTCDDRPLGAVPASLRDAHYKGAAALGHGIGYDYPHDDPRGFVEARYLPEELADRRYYEPSEHGTERLMAERWQLRRSAAVGAARWNRRDLPGRTARSDRTERLGPHGADDADRSAGSDREVGPDSEVGQVGGAERTAAKQREEGRAR